MAYSSPKVFIWRKENLEQNVKEGELGLSFLRLEHPRTRTPATFLLNSSNGMLQEILTFADGHRSWFSNDSVLSDGKFRICTPMDRLLLLLPYLEENESNFSPLHQIISNEDFPDNHKVFDESIKEIPIADKKSAAGHVVYKFNKEKTLNWLSDKINSVSKVLKDRQINVTSGSFTTSYVDAKVSATDDDFIRYAHGLLSEYISDNLSRDLLIHCKIPEPPETEASTAKRPAEDETGNEKSKRSKNDSSEEPAEDYSNFGKNSKSNDKVDTAKLSMAQKKLFNSNKKGMKSIQSFFAKPK